MNTEMSTERKAEMFDRDREHAERLRNQPFQIFRVNEDGRWIQVLARSCAPSIDGENSNYFAIIEGTPYPVTIEGAGSSFVPFPGGDDGEMEYHFRLMANQIEVGECSYREY